MVQKKIIGREAWVIERARRNNGRKPCEGSNRERGDTERTKTRNMKPSAKCGPADSNLTFHPKIKGLKCRQPNESRVKEGARGRRQKVNHQKRTGGDTKVV